MRRFLLVVAAAAAAAALIWAALRWFLWWLMPFLLAAGLASALEPLIALLQRRLRLRRSFCAAVLTLFLLFLLGGFLALLLGALWREALGLLARLPDLLQQLPALLDALGARIDRYCAACPPWLLAWREALERSAASQLPSLLSSLAEGAWSALRSAAALLPRALLAAATTVLALYFFAASRPQLRAALRLLPAAQQAMLRAMRSAAVRSLLRWLRAQGTLFALTFFQLLAGFALLRVEYALLAALLTALVDALPVFGTGTILVPWAVLSLLLGNVPLAIALLALYACTQLVRSIVEPKLIAAQAGLAPVVSLLAMYLGWCAFGVGGMLALPLLLLFAVQLFRGAQR